MEPAEVRIEAVLTGRLAQEILERSGGDIGKMREMVHTTILSGVLGMTTWYSAAGGGYDADKCITRVDIPGVPEPYDYTRDDLNFDAVRERGR